MDGFFYAKYLFSFKKESSSYIFAKLICTMESIIEKDYIICGSCNLDLKGTRNTSTVPTVLSVRGVKSIIVRSVTMKLLSPLSVQFIKTQGINLSDI